MLAKDALPEWISLFVRLLDNFLTIDGAAGVTSSRTIFVNRFCEPGRRPFDLLLGPNGRPLPGTGWPNQRGRLPMRE
jgi:hypothetical protein